MKIHTEEEIPQIHRRMNIGAAVSSVFWVCVGVVIFVVRGQLAVEWADTMDTLLTFWFLIPMILIIVCMVGLLNVIGR